MQAIPKRLYHIWVGPLEPPVEWMKTWRAHHPDWQYMLLDNAFLQSRRWRLQGHIDEYMARGDYAGVSDIMRYEVLFECGGFIASADTVCLKPVDDLFVEDLAYVARENDIYCPESLSPVIAAPSDNLILKRAMKAIEGVPPKSMGDPWVTTGNLLMGFLARKDPAKFKFLSSRLFVPQHYSGLYYQETEETYCREFFGTGTGGYSRQVNGFWRRKKLKILRARSKRYKRDAKRSFDAKLIPWLNMSNWEEGSKFRY